MSHQGCAVVAVSYSEAEEAKFKKARMGNRMRFDWKIKTH